MLRSTEYHFQLFLWSCHNYQCQSSYYQYAFTRVFLYFSGFQGGAENAGVENAGVDRTDGKCRSEKYRSDNVWKAIKQKIKILNISIKSRSTGCPLVPSTTELTGLVPGVGVPLFEADSESDSDSEQEPGLWGTPPPHPWMYGLTVWAVYAVRTNRTLFS